MDCNTKSKSTFVLPYGVQVLFQCYLYINPTGVCNVLISLFAFAQPVQLTSAQHL